MNSLLEQYPELPSLALLVLLLAIIFGLCAWVIKRYWIDKKYLSDTSRMVGRHILTQFKNEDDRECMDYVIYQSEDDRKETDSGDPAVKFINPDDKTPNNTEKKQEK